MGVGVQRKAGVGMPEDSRQGFRIHAARQRVSGEGVAPDRGTESAEAPPVLTVFLIGGKHSRGASVFRAHRYSGISIR